MASSTRRTAATRPKRRVEDELVDGIASLSLSDKAEQRLASMRAVNSASQELSTIVQSGWRKSGDPKSTFATKSNAAATKAAKHLAILRDVSPDDVDIERAAGSVLGKLVALEMMDSALSALKEMHPRLCAILKVNTQTRKSTEYLYLLSLPCTESESSPVIMNLVTTFLLHSLLTLSSLPLVKKALPAFTTALTKDSTILSWSPALSSSHSDSLLTRAYSGIMKLAGSLQSYPRETFLLRDYALRCLARTSPGKIESGLFWEQCVKAAGAYIKALGSAPDEAQTILLSFTNIVTLAQSRDDAESFLTGKGFISFCEYWMSLATRLGDIPILNRVALLIGNQPGTSKSATQSTSPSSSSDDILLRGTQLYTVLSQTTALLDSASEPDQLRSNLQRTIEMLNSDGLHMMLLPTEPAHEISRISGKVQRAIERLRRSAVKFVDKNPMLEVQDILDTVTTILEAALNSETPPIDLLLTPALDTLFALAKLKLNIRDPLSYETSYSFLQRAAALLETNDPETLAKANYIRCISGAFHNIAGTLYQAEKYAGASRFLHDGCRLGEQAFDMYSRTRGTESTKMSEGWLQLEEQLWRRYELLAVCCSKIGDRKLALKSFIKAASCYPYRRYEFGKIADSCAGIDVFKTIAGGMQLSNIVDRITHLGVFDLFLPASDISLRSVQPLTMAGALLERQMQSLEGSKWKENGRTALRILFGDLLATYGDINMPVRRARVLVSILEFMYHVGSEHVIEWGSPSEIGDQVERILTQNDFGQDSGLAGFAPQWRAVTHLWLALHAHRSGDCEQTRRVAHHVEMACSVFEPMAGIAAPVRPSPSVTKKISVKKPPATQKKKVVPPRRIPATKKTPASINPKTPQPRPRQTVEAQPATSAEPSNTASIIEDFDKLVDLLELVACILGLLTQDLLKVRLLEITRRLCEKYPTSSTDGYLTASAELALEYMKLGKSKRAYTILTRSLDIMKSGKHSDGAGTMFYLRHAECMALSEDLMRSSELYREALTRAQLVSEETKGMMTAERVRFRVGNLERAAVACHVFALMQHCREDTAASLESILQSLRLWNRALDALTRLRPQPSKPIDEDDNPFSSSPKTDAASTEQPMPSKTFPRRNAMSSMEWRVCDGLLATLFALCEAYFTRGSAREAEYFAQQAFDLAQSINTPALAARALAKKGELQLHQRQLQEAHLTLLQANDLLENLSGRDIADIRRLRGDYSHLSSQDKDARQLYEEATSILEGLDKNFGVLDEILSTRRTSELTNVEILHPDVLATVLRQHIWLLRNVGEDRTRLLQRFLTLPAGPRSKAQENALMAKLTLHEVYERFATDMFLSSMAESTIALPMGMSSEKALTIAPSTHDVLRTLENAEHLFWLEVSLFSRKGDVSRVRDAVVSLALIRALQTSLGKSGRQDAVLVAGLLDVSSAITLSREMLEAVHHKFPAIATDDLEWPLTSRNGSPVLRGKQKRLVPQSQGFDSDLDVSDDEDDEQQALRDYWEHIRSKYQSQAPDISTISASQMANVPQNWTILHMGVTDDKSTLFVTRQYGGDVSTNPLVFCIPLKGRREEDETDSLTFDAALREFDEIIRLSDEGTRRAIHVKNEPEARAQWWKERTALDQRLRELLENIEYCWLGAFKTILSPRANLSASAISDLRVQFDKVFHRGLRFQDKNFKTKPALAHRRMPSETQIPSRVTLDDVLLECFSTLSPQCRDEELEDLVFFVLDLYQFHGVPVAIAEVDIDQVVVDLRGVLEGHHARLAGRRRGEPPVTKVEEDEHMFLILDKNIQGLPWESIPTLRGQSISRIPSVDFLLDRLELAGWGSKEPAKIDRARVDPRNGYCLLNPSGDLVRTEGRFKDWLKGMEKAGWQSLVGQAPSEQQFLDALRKKDLVVYFGHGGAEQYARSHKIRQLPRCAATMLWGCSSGILREMGDFDRVGTPHNYMLAGCPTLVANMWDVTDRDIDVFSQSVFDKLHLDAESARDWTGNGQTSLVAAVAQSRSSCKLKYLTGAAPVVYGIPFYL
ncbi:Cysteine peptidase C50 [Mycena indigotica]|uniref:separase n=1 Tax=Mycena indigotica TaxID=2126181 RepID=A0A8H6VUW5_9AGAR|nr:Cysteine peptidase C50 [Mycena indigotica]KAF7294812.1 Cysteine peptidase C50 [Mycena indigotica]